jgi:hypothetical protein
MKQLDDTIFDEAGLGDLTPTEKERMLAYVAKTLETRVGIRLASEATKEQLEEFTEVSNQGNDGQTFTWLEKLFPDFQKIVQEELADIKGELADMAEEVLQARK